MKNRSIFYGIFALVTLASCFTNDVQAQNATWAASKLRNQGYITKTGTFTHPQFGEVPVKGRLRFINIRHDGPVKSSSVKQSFLSAVRWYDNQNVTARPGGDNNFFKISGLSKNRCVILGWCFYYNWGGEQKIEYNYIVVNMITQGTVSYYQMNGTHKLAYRNPNHFINYNVGTKNTPSSRIRIQIWKHGKDQHSACVCLWKN